MFESLSDKLQNITRKLRGQARITEKDLKEMLREVKLALLEADVNVKVAREFVAKLKTKIIIESCILELTLLWFIIELVLRQVMEVQPQYTNATQTTGNSITNAKNGEDNDTIDRGRLTATVMGDVF